MDIHAFTQTHTHTYIYVRTYICAETQLKLHISIGVMIFCSVGLCNRLVSFLSTAGKSHSSKTSGMYTSVNVSNVHLRSCLRSCVDGCLTDLMRCLLKCAEYVCGVKTT